MINRVKSFVLLLALGTVWGCSGPSPLPLIIDADTANEVDDLYALVRALKAPELDVVGITSAQFHTSPLTSDTSALESQHLNETIVSLMNRHDVPVAPGANEPITEGTPRPSEATALIIEEARRYSAENPLHVVILGSCTNVASAILLEPAIVPNLHVHYLGFWHDPGTNAYDKKEFNSGNDTLAVEVLLDTPNLMMDVMTATTSQRLVFAKETVDSYLAEKEGIAQLLVERWETFDRWWTDEDPEKREWIMWDVAIIEALIDPQNATLQHMSTPPENTSRSIGIYTAIDVPAMKASFWEAVAGD